MSEINVARALPKREGRLAFGDPGYQCARKGAEAKGPTWHVTLRRGEHIKLNQFIEPQFLAERAGKMTACIRVKAKHPVHVVKNLFGQQHGKTAPPVWLGQSGHRQKAAAGRLRPKRKRWTRTLQVVTPAKLKSASRGIVINSRCDAYSSAPPERLAAAQIVLDAYARALGTSDHRVV